MGRTSWGEAGRPCHLAFRPLNSSISSLKMLIISAADGSNYTNLKKNYLAQTTIGDYVSISVSAVFIGRTSPNAMHSWQQLPE
jgi:hypothetical protein